MTYEELLIEADCNQLITKEKNLPISKGRIKGNKIAIQKGMTSNEKACILAEELGHYYTTFGNILDQSNSKNRKQEVKARHVAYERMIGLSGIIDAYKAGCKNRFEIANHLNITEYFLEEALIHYKSKYGLFSTFDGYVIYFEPLGVLKLCR